MNITSDTAASLGEKLAGLNLTDEEGVLLTTLLGDESEVSGFGADRPAPDGFSLNFEEIKVTYMPRVLDPLPGAWKREGGEHYYQWKLED